MKKIRIDKDLYLIPAEWNEMNAEDLCFLASLAMGSVSAQRLKLCMLLRLLNARVSNLNPLKMAFVPKDEYLRKATVLRIQGREYPVTAAQMAALSDVCDFLLKRDDGGEYSLAPALTKNPYPKFWTRGHIYFGPADDCFDLTFEQYMYLATYMDALQEDPERIGGLLATLWHNAPHWYAEGMEADAAALSRLGNEQKMVMFWFAASCLLGFARMFPRLFSGGGTSGISGNALDNQLRLLNSLAGGDMTKKDAVRRGLLMDAFYSMDENVRQADEFRRKSKD